MKTEMFPSNLCIKRYVCVLGKVYAVGGHDGNEHLESMEVFDPLTNKWMMKASMNTRRCVSCDPKFMSWSVLYHLLLMLKNIMCGLPLFRFPNYAIFRNFFFPILGLYAIKQLYLLAVKQTQIAYLHSSCICRNTKLCITYIL